MKPLADEPVAGSQQWMRERCGLTGPAVAASVVARLGASR